MDFIIDQPKGKGKRRRRPRQPAGWKLQIATEAQLQGLLPLDYMLAVVRDENATPGRRDMMARAAAPYCHARMTTDAPVRVQPRGKKDIQAEAAATAGVGTEWASDLEFDDRVN